MIVWEDTLVSELKENEVFVFGSNATGFHGAGSAGLACRGDNRNTWRTDPWFLKAMKAPVGSPDRIGKWAVYGVARGPQRGTQGKSYAIQTITRPGQLRTTPRSEIQEQILKLYEFTRSRPHLTFLITPIGEGYAGYTKAEMDEVWSQCGTPPSNCRFIGRKAGKSAT